MSYLEILFLLAKPVYYNFLQLWWLRVSCSSFGSQFPRRTWPSFIWLHCSCTSLYYVTRKTLAWWWNGYIKWFFLTVNHLIHWQKLNSCTVCLKLHYQWSINIKCIWSFNIMFIFLWKWWLYLSCLFCQFLGTAYTLLYHNNAFRWVLFFF